MKQHVIKAFILTMFSSGIFFVFNFLLAKYLGAKSYGEIAYIISFVNIVSLFITMNYVSLYMGNAIVESDHHTFSLFFSVHTVLFFIILLPAVYILSYFIEERSVVLLILGVSYVSVLVKTIGLEYNTQKEIIKSIVLSTFTPRVLMVVFYVSMLIWGINSTKGYLYAFLLSNLVIVLYVFGKYRPVWYLKKSFFSRAFKFYFLGVLGSSFVYIAQILQKQYADYIALANLSVALLIFAGLSLFGTVLVKFVLPRVHELYREYNIEKIGILYQNNTFLELLVVAPVFTILFFEIHTIADFLGNSYDDFKNYFYILSIGYGLGLFTGIAGNLLRALKHESLEIYNEIIRMVVGFGLIFLLHEYDFGIVIALTVSMFVYNMIKCLELFILYRFIPLSLEKLFIVVVYIGGMVIVEKWIASIDSIWMRVGSYALLLLGIYGLLFFYLKNRHGLFEGYK